MVGAPPCSIRGGKFPTTRSLESPSKREILASAKDIDAPLTLELGGEDITPELFVRGVRSFFAILNELTDQIDDSVGWRIQVKQGSNLVGVFPRGMPSQASVGSIIASVQSGLAMLEKEAREPEHFPERALEGVRDLAKLSVGSDGEMTVKIWAGKTAQCLSAHSIAHIDDILSSGFEEQGAVSGKVQTVSERGGARFVIYQPTNAKPVNCIVPEEQLPLVLKAFGHRAEIYGMVKYRRDGTPQRIKVEDIVQFPDDADLPRHTDVLGVLRNSPR